MSQKHYHKESTQFEELFEEQTGHERHLILHNDDVHTFDYVIESLIKVCEMEPIQAEQCTYLVHYKGKCDVKTGGLEFLRPYRKGLIERGLEATID